MAESTATSTSTQAASSTKLTTVYEVNKILRKELNQILYQLPGVLVNLIIEYNQFTPIFFDPRNGTDVYAFIGQGINKWVKFLSVKDLRRRTTRFIISEIGGGYLMINTFVDGNSVDDDDKNDSDDYGYNQSITYLVGIYNNRIVKCRGDNFLGLLDENKIIRQDCNINIWFEDPRTGAPLYIGNGDDIYHKHPSLSNYLFSRNWIATLVERPSLPLGFGSITARYVNPPVYIPNTYQFVPIVIVDNFVILFRANWRIELIMGRSSLFVNSITDGQVDGQVILVNRFTNETQQYLWSLPPIKNFYKIRARYDDDSGCLYLHDLDPFNDCYYSCEPLDEFGSFNPESKWSKMSLS